MQDLKPKTRLHDQITEVNYQHMLHGQLNMEGMWTCERNFGMFWGSLSVIMKKERKHRLQQKIFRIVENTTQTMVKDLVHDNLPSWSADIWCWSYGVKLLPQNKQFLQVNLKWNVVDLVVHLGHTCAGIYHSSHMAELMHAGAYRSAPCSGMVR